VPGSHFVQEDSPTEIGEAVVELLRRLGGQIAVNAATLGGRRRLRRGGESSEIWSLGAVTP